MPLYQIDTAINALKDIDLCLCYKHINKQAQDQIKATVEDAIVYLEALKAEFEILEKISINLKESIVYSEEFENKLREVRDALYNPEMKRLLSTTPEGKTCWEKIKYFFIRFFLKNEGEQLLDEAKSAYLEIKHEVQTSKRNEQKLLADAGKPKFDLFKWFIPKTAKEVIGAGEVIREDGVSVAVRNKIPNPHNFELK